MRIGARRLFAVGLVSLCTLVAGLFSSAAALAAEAPEAPGPVTIESVTASEATFHGVLNPGKAGVPGTYELDSYEFLYRKSKTTCEGESRAPEPAGMSLGGGKEGVSQAVSGLQPGTAYTVCLRASNPEGEEALGQPETFTTEPVAPNVEEESVFSVASTSATLTARIDPNGADTRYRFEYATPGGEYRPVPEGEGDAGAGVTSVPVHVHIDGGLTPDTTYRFRVHATNAVEGVDGTERSFATQPVGGLFTLPDGRQYELVSPPQKDGSEIVGIGGESKLARFGGATQAADDGGSVTYLANAPVGDSVSGNPIGEQLFSTRVTNGEGAQEWRTQNISVPHHSTVGGSIVLGFEEYVRFSSDLSRSVLLPSLQTTEFPLAPEIHEEVHAGGNFHERPEIYLRDDASGTFRAVNTVEPLSAVQFEGATPDLEHVVFEGPAGLDPRHPGGGGLYEWTDGQTQLVDVLPEGEIASGRSVLVSATALNDGSVLPSGPVRNAISDDGTRVVWSSEAGGLYSRDMATGETVQVDAARGGAGPSGGGTFVAASRDGTRVLFTDSNELTGGAHEGGLFMFDVLDGKLTDLTPTASGGQMQALFGVGEEATSLYELSSAVLTKEPSSQGKVADEGESNLYLLREQPDGSWSTTFITAGAEGGSRSSADGGYLAFMSRQSLTGYDTEDVTSENPGEKMDVEVYLYSASANSLVCVSCNPTGQRPVAEYDNTSSNDETFPVSPMDAMGAWRSSWLAGSIPGVTHISEDSSSGYQPRSLSDSGRLFYDSADALVPRDVNGHADVYEYEPVGVGSCQPPSYGQSGSVVFEAAEGGCVGLISAGTGSRDSVFFDASADGSDVFFTTEQGLVPQDNDGAADMYDARVCTASEPCVSAAAVSPPCSTPDSCRAAPAPQPSVFGAPSSATFSGQGNVAAPAEPVLVKKVVKKTVKCRKNHRRSHGKCVLIRKSGKAKRAGYKRGAHS